MIEQSLERMECRTGKPWSGVEKLGKNNEWGLHEEVSSFNMFMSETLQ